MENRLTRVELCPRCGSLPEVHKVGDRKALFALFCPKCQVTYIRLCEARHSLHGAKHIWNRRVREYANLLDRVQDPFYSKVHPHDPREGNIK